MTELHHAQRNAVSVVGLGKLGLCFAACLADRGFRTIGIDIDDELVNRVNSGQAPLSVCSDQGWQLCLRLYPLNLIWVMPAKGNSWRCND